jgi:hypothetical protein
VANRSPTFQKRLYDTTVEVRRDIYHGEAKRKFHIIDCHGYWTVKRRFIKFWFYVRQKNFKKLKFYEFGDVVRYVNKRK